MPSVGDRWSGGSICVVAGVNDMSMSMTIGGADGIGTCDDRCCGSYAGGGSSDTGCSCSAYTTHAQHMHKPATTKATTINQRKLSPIFNPHSPMSPRRGGMVVVSIVNEVGGCGWLAVGVGDR